MADYKRMVSYMYQYENGVKRKNVGYARIEARNGECKFTIHMQLPGLLDSIFPTYLIQRQGEDMELIYLGDAFLKNQVIDSKMLAKESNIMDSGYGLSDIGGILLFLNEAVFYATEWDDKPVVLAEVMEALKPKDSQVLKSIETGSKDQGEAQQSLETPDKGYLEEELMKESLPKVEESEDESEEEKSEEEDEEEEFDESQTEEDQAEENGTEEDGSEEDTPGLPKPIIGMNTSVQTSQEAETIPVRNNQASMAEEAAIPVYKMPRGWKTVEYLQKPKEQQQTVNPWKTVHQYQKPKEEPKSEQPVKEYGQNYEQGLSAAGNQAGADSTNSMNMNFMKEEQDKSENPLASRILENYPRIYPFEDNEITMCVKIEPKDIGILPVDAWVLSNNSFLLHGYYCYHHLIFAKLNDRSGCHYILGVPGIYHNRERFMARMFGFECFKSIRKRELRQGDFGYWYIPISM